MFRQVNLKEGANNYSPLMSSEAIEYHYGKHYAAYVTNTNKAIIGQPCENASLADVVDYARVHTRPRLLQNAGQTWNHGFFFASLAAKEGSVPTGDFATAIDSQFGGHGGLSRAFVAEAAKHFGSGWIWLVTDSFGVMSLIRTQDHEPVWLNHEATALAVCDLWEHAYYIDWRNNRSGFVEAYIGKWVDWSLAVSQYSAAQRGEFGWRHP